MFSFGFGCWLQLLELLGWHGSRSLLPFDFWRLQRPHPCVSEVRLHFDDPQRLLSPFWASRGFLWFKYKDDTLPPEQVWSCFELSYSFIIFQWESFVSLVFLSEIGRSAQLLWELFLVLLLSKHSSAQMKAKAKPLESYSYISLTFIRKHFPIHLLIFYKGAISFYDSEPVHTIATLALELGSISPKRLFCCHH